MLFDKIVQELTGLKKPLYQDEDDIYTHEYNTAIDDAIYTIETLFSSDTPPATQPLFANDEKWLQYVKWVMENHSTVPTTTFATAPFDYDKIY